MCKYKENAMFSIWLSQIMTYDTGLTIHSTWVCTYFLRKGVFTIYVDQFSEFLDPSLPIGRPFIYWGLFSKVDIWLTPPSLSGVYVDCECPLTYLFFFQMDFQ